MESDVAAILDEARRRNVTMIDTAIAWAERDGSGQGGPAISRSSARYLLCRTNLPSAPLIANKIAGSLDLLRVDQLHAASLHNADDLPANRLGRGHAACWMREMRVLCLRLVCRSSSPAAGTIPPALKWISSRLANLLDRRVLEAGSFERDGRGGVSFQIHLLQGRW